ncbi:hypothetical protein EK21DRAFT_75464 [Setomelanomma holmii]|uniref:BZIP domain-containing protein n=1 Tax=Setomelanomma holmii TaxID=210430 RepID=A0A9P4H2D7_9PLEO|nr:hypothetical protein EK21DRAFT_75464 [Setomelanomma holmii]
MTSPSTLQSQPISRPGRRSRRVEEGEELGKKPKKVNSEIRKQQNRIASRNYREKRKRKLQYLQQLIKDGSNDELTPETSPQQQEAQLPPFSTDREAGPSSSPFILPSSGEFTSLNSNVTTAMSSDLVATSGSFDNHTLTNTLAYPPFELPWSSPVYDPPPPANAIWTIPTWGSMHSASRATPRPSSLQFSSPVGQTVFEQGSSPYHHPRQFTMNSDHYIFDTFYGHFIGPQSQSPGIPNYFLGSLPQAFERSVYI